MIRCDAAAVCRTPAFATMLTYHICCCAAWHRSDIRFTVLSLSRWRLVQILSFEDAHHISLPSIVRVNGSVFLQSLVTFTEERFLRSAAATPATPSGSAKKRKTDCALAKGLTVPDHELEAAKLVFEIMQDRAPAELSVNDVDQLLDICKFSLVDKLVAGFGTYILPIAQSVQAADVRLVQANSLWIA
jgi:hypothetical protein